MKKKTWRRLKTEVDDRRAELKEKKRKEIKREINK